MMNRLSLIRGIVEQMVWKAALLLFGYLVPGIVFLGAITSILEKDFVHLLVMVLALLVSRNAFKLFEDFYKKSYPPPMRRITLDVAPNVVVIVEAPVGAALSVQVESTNPSFYQSNTEPMEEGLYD